MTSEFWLIILDSSWFLYVLLNMWWCITLHVRYILCIDIIITSLEAHGPWMGPAEPSWQSRVMSLKEPSHTRGAQLIFFLSLRVRDGQDSWLAGAPISRRFSTINSTIMLCAPAPLVLWIIILIIYIPKQIRKILLYEFSCFW